MVIAVIQVGKNKHVYSVPWWHVLWSTNFHIWKWCWTEVVRLGGAHTEVYSDEWSWTWMIQMQHQGFALYPQSLWSLYPHGGLLAVREILDMLRNLNKCIPFCNMHACSFQNLGLVMFTGHPVVNLIINTHMQTCVDSTDVWSHGSNAMCTWMCHWHKWRIYGASISVTMETNLWTFCFMNQVGNVVKRTGLGRTLHYIRQNVIFAHCVKLS